MVLPRPRSSTWKVRLNRDAARRALAPAAIMATPRLLTAHEADMPPFAPKRILLVYPKFPASFWSFG
jgi:hypothetical protein